MRVAIPALPAFRRALAKMAADAAAPEPGPSGRASIFPHFSVEAPMPRPRPRPITPDLSPPSPPCGGPTETRPVTGPEFRIQPPAYPRRGMGETPCGVCGKVKDIGTLCTVLGCPWSAERDDTPGRPYGVTPDEFRAASRQELRRTEARHIGDPAPGALEPWEAMGIQRKPAARPTVDLAPHAAARAITDFVTVEISGADGRGMFRDVEAIRVGDGLTDADLKISCDRPFPRDTVHVSGCGALDGRYRVVSERTVRPAHAAPDIPVLRAVVRPPVAPPAPPAPPPFDPVRAWGEVALAWMRCAYVTAEIPMQLALYHRVSVGL